MEILIAGSSGFIGSNLISFLSQKGHTVHPIKREDILHNSEKLIKKIEGTDVVINLSGAPVIKRWTSSYKKEIYQSRINTTSTLVNAINSCEQKPNLFISASAIGIYDSVHIHNEASTFFDEKLLGTVCKEWEQKANKALCKRVVIPRIGVVLSNTGGAFPKMYKPFKIGFGGKISNGKQAFSFIHLQDLLNAFLFIINNEQISGAINFVAPETSTNKNFTIALSRIANKPAIFTVPAFILKLIYGEGASVLLEGQNAIPAKLLKEGFEFKYDTLEKTLKEILL